MRRGLGVRQIGFGVGAATAAALGLHAALATLLGGARAEDLRAYAVMIGIGAVAFTVAGFRGGRQAGWGYLVTATMAAVGADNDLPVLWLYVGGYLLAVALTQVAPIWQVERADRQRARPTSGVEAFRAMGEDDGGHN